jgi:transmembrane 9 superfamily protein 2/4
MPSIFAIKMPSTFPVVRRLAILLAWLSCIEAFYIPGMSPLTLIQTWLTLSGYHAKYYKDQESIPLLVNKVYSDNTQLQFAYYDLPFVCPPTGQKHLGSSLMSGQSVALNLGEVLRGDRIVTSDIELTMGQDTECKSLCSKVVSRRDIKRARELVKDGYVAEWIVDNLPGATSFVTVDKTRKYYAAGFKMGYRDYSPSSGKPRYYLNNHITIVLRWRKVDGEPGVKGYKVIIGFEVYTKSVGPGERGENGCPADIHAVENPMELYMPPNGTDWSAKYPDSSYYPAEAEVDLDDGATMEIPYSYSVYFREDDTISWARRWDLYFVNQEEGSRIHWLAIVNSVIIAGLLSAIVAMILARTIRGDIKSYREGGAEEAKVKRARKSRPGSGARTPRLGEKIGGLLEQPGGPDNDGDVSSDDEPLEDITGWKLLHGDVFRAPAYGYILAPLIGSGMQLVFMAVGLLVLSSLGVLNPSWRGGFVSVGVGLFVFAGVFSGYFSGQVYKTFGGQNWRRNTIITATLFPGLLFGLVFVLNLFVWVQASSTALPITTLISLVLLWLGIQVPLVYIGSWYGFVRSAAWEHPTKTTAIPRQIPSAVWYIRGFQSILLAGLIPFAVIFIELLFVFQSMWQDKSGYYYVFGFLTVVSLILILTIAEVTIVTIYIQLCNENYNWWWQSFFVGGGSAIWVFLYCVWYFFMKLHITGFVSGLLFFAYSGMACLVYGLLCGTIGFLTAYAFVRRIYRLVVQVQAPT